MLFFRWELVVLVKLGINWKISVKVKKVIKFFFYNFFIIIFFYLKIVCFLSKINFVFVVIKIILYKNIWLELLDFGFVILLFELFFVVGVVVLLLLEDFIVLVNVLVEFLLKCNLIWYLWW